MGLLQRNVTGYDILAMRTYIDNRGPVTEPALLDDYYPGDPDNRENSEQLKPIRDCLRFLVEVDQVEETDDGYVISEELPGGLRPRLALLWGIRRQDGEDSAYSDVLEHLAANNIREFDHGDELVDIMDGAKPELPWNPDRLRYWRRVMNTLGVTQAVNPDGEDVTTLLFLEPDLLRDLVAYCLDADTGSLPEVLKEVNETFLPVYTSQETISTYIQVSLMHAERHGRVKLTRRSDRDVSIEIGETPYNSIRLTQ